MAAMLGLTTLVPSQSFAHPRSRSATSSGVRSAIKRGWNRTLGALSESRGNETNVLANDSTGPLRRADADRSAEHYEEAARRYQASGRPAHATRMRRMAGWQRAAAASVELDAPGAIDRAFNSVDSLIAQASLAPVGPNGYARGDQSEVMLSVSTAKTTLSRVLAHTRDTNKRALRRAANGYVRLARFERRLGHELNDGLADEARTMLLAADALHRAGDATSAQRIRIDALQEVAEQVDHHQLRESLRSASPNVRARAHYLAELLDQARVR